MRAIASDFDDRGGSSTPNNPSYLKVVDDDTDSNTLSPWVVLVVDDEEDVHRLIRLITEDMRFRNAPLRIVSAYSATQAREILQDTNVAVMLLDVMMESDTAGLDLVRYVREVQDDTATRVIIFTGQPGLAPERQVVNEYDINGYMNKADVSSQQMTTMLMTSLRMYADYKTIEALARNQRSLADALKSQNEELDRVNRELRDSLSENRALQDRLGNASGIDTQINHKLAELEMLKERAEIANQTKSEFIASMNHELRNPLQTIMGHAGILLHDNEPLTSEQRGSLQEINNASQHMLSIVDDILELSKIEAGTHEVAIEPINLAEIARGCCNLMQQMASERSVQLINHIDADTPLALGSERSIKQVLINLISNAIKYNRAHGRVDLSCDLSADAIEISVEDNGIGIPTELHERIFKPFDRLARNDASVGGTGIGLNITQRLLRELDSDLRFTSRENEGSRFYFRLPIQQQD